MTGLFGEVLIAVSLLCGQGNFACVSDIVDCLHKEPTAWGSSNDTSETVSKCLKAHIAKPKVKK